MNRVNDPVLRLPCVVKLHLRMDSPDPNGGADIQANLRHRAMFRAYDLDPCDERGSIDRGADGNLRWIHRLLKRLRQWIALADVRLNGATPTSDGPIGRHRARIENRWDGQRLSLCRDRDEKQRDGQQVSHVDIVRQVAFALPLGGW